MKNITKFRTIALSLMMLIGLIPLTSFAQQRNDDFFRNDFDNYENREEIAIWALTNGIQNDDFGESPLGSGLLILTAVGAGYAISRRKSYKTYKTHKSYNSGATLFLALALLLGMTNCRKKIVEPIALTNGNKVAIILNVGDGAKVEVYPPHVNFETGDEILVAHDGIYVGTLTYTEYETGKYRFQGDIDADVAEPRQKLYFYFLGNKQGSLDIGEEECTVDISDQTDYHALPVISFSASNEDFTGTGNYSAKLNNKCSLIKFNVTTDSNSPICITDMNNKVTVSFADRSSNDGFSYSKESGGVIKLKGGSGTNVEKWAVVLQQDALDAGGEGTAYTENCEYIGARAAVPAITMDQYLNEDRAMTVNTPGWDGDLSKVTNESTEAFATARDGMTIYGTLGVNKKISIADGATVTLNNATINGVNNWSYQWAGLNCLGDATINLADGTTNTVKGFYENYPGIHVPSGNTLTIQGTGTLNASSNGYGAGIGGGNGISCGNITIRGGTITATGGENAAGIGAGYGNNNESVCGIITITSGTITATGGSYAAGIGSGVGGGGNSSSCGAISIASTVTRVTATKGSGAPNSIGAGSSGTCGTVTIGGVEGAISESPYTYPAATGHALSASVVGEVVGTDGLAYAVVDKDNLPTGVTAAGMVAYKSGSNGLVIALADEASTMNWSTANGTTTGAAAHTPTVTGQTWKLPSQAEWQRMFIANGGNQNSYTGLNTTLAAAGGDSSKLQEYSSYWSSTNGGVDHAYYVSLTDGDALFFSVDKGYPFRVRACLAF
ncbi:MAG: hypothetical protein J6P64_09630 [Bacteroidales bacterium]|nr:hypothetical protein [Bacteroidales bacterium]